jgi:hypothetical protein
MYPCKLPVSKDLCSVDNEMVFIADWHGALHLMDLPNLAIKLTYRLSNNELSAPLLIRSHTCVLRGYDEMLRCVNDTGMIWDRPVGAAVYSKARDAALIVCRNCCSFDDCWKSRCPEFFHRENPVERTHPS